MAKKLLVPLTVSALCSLIVAGLDPEPYHLTMVVLYLVVFLVPSTFIWFICMVWKSRAAVVLCITLYAFTWCGGWLVASKQIHSKANAMYGQARISDLRMLTICKEEKLPPMRMRCNPSGPIAGVNWCVPLLPGILLMDSEYQIGPLWGKGGTNIVLFYGFGFIDLLHLVIWIS